MRGAAIGGSIALKIPGSLLLLAPSLDRSMIDGSVSGGRQRKDGVTATVGSSFISKDRLEVSVARSFRLLDYSKERSLGLLIAAQQSARAGCSCSLSTLLYIEFQFCFCPCELLS